MNASASEYTSILINTIKEARQLKRLSQEAIAERTGIPLRTYQRIEIGEMPPRLDALFKILYALDIKPRDVFLNIFNMPSSEDETSSPAEALEFNSWVSNSTTEPILIASVEVEGLKKALTENYEKGVEDVGYWEWKINTNEFYWSPQMYRIYGIDPQKDFDHVLYRSKIYPEDLKNIDEDLLKLTKLNITYDNTHRVTVDDKIIYVHARAKICAIANGEKIIFGIAQRVPNLTNSR